MSDQLYRLSDYWYVEDWPFSADPDEIARISEVLPRGYEFHIECNEDCAAVGLYEYVGEYDLEVLE